MEAVLTKAKVPTGVLQDVVARAAKGSTYIDAIPLSCLMSIQISNNTLIVKSTDNRNFVTITAPVETSDIDFVVDSKLFAQLISKLDSEYTEFSIEGNNVIVQSRGAFTISIATDNGNKIVFPDKTFTPNGSTIHVESNELKSILSLNKACKPVMKDMPALFNYYFDDTRALTTDGFKACLNSIKFSDRPMVLTPDVLELASAVDEGGIDVSQDDENIMFSSPKGTIVAKKANKTDLEKFPAEDLIEGTFATTLENSIEIDKSIFCKVLDRLCLFTSELQSHKLSFKFSKTGITVEDTNTGSSEFLEYTSSHLSEDFEDLQMDLDANYLRTQLMACSNSVIPISFSDTMGIILKCDKASLALSIIDIEENV